MYYFFIMKFKINMLVSFAGSILKFKFKKKEYL